MTKPPSEMTGAELCKRWVYRITGYPFTDVGEEQCTTEQSAAVDALLRLFWGDDRSAQLRISIRHRGVAGSGRRCTAESPICMQRVHDPDDCTCTGFEKERGGNEIVITRGKPRLRIRVAAARALLAAETGEKR